MGIDYFVGIKENRSDTAHHKLMDLRGLEEGRQDLCLYTEKKPLTPLTRVKNITARIAA